MTGSIGRRINHIVCDVLANEFNCRLMQHYNDKGKNSRKLKYEIGPNSSERLTPADRQAILSRIDERLRENEIIPLSLLWRDVPGDGFYRAYSRVIVEVAL